MKLALSDDAPDTPANLQLSVKIEKLQGLLHHSEAHVDDNRRLIDGNATQASLCTEKSSQLLLLASQQSGNLAQFSDVITSMDTSPMKLGNSPSSLRLPSSSPPSDPTPSVTLPTPVDEVVEEISDDDALTVDQLSSAWPSFTQDSDSQESLPKRRRYSTRLAGK